MTFLFVQRTHLLERRVFIPAPISSVFDFFSQAENLDRITPPWLGFRLLTPLPIVMAQGTRIDYSLRLNGLRFTWKSRITHWQPPHVFEDTQIKGPYLTWVHHHDFKEGAGGTVMKDRVSYAVSGAYFEPLVHNMLVRPRLRAIFDYREKTLLEIFKDG